MSETDFMDDKVICPNCTHIFTAVPVGTQKELATLRQRALDAEQIMQAELPEAVAILKQMDALRADNERLRAALTELLTAVRYKGPPVNFGEGNPCWEARIPVEFVDRAEAAIENEEAPANPAPGV